MLKTVIDNILYYKDQNMVFNEEYMKSFNYFLLLKVFSCRPELFLYCSYLNKLLMNTSLSKSQIHHLFLKIFPKLDYRKMDFKNLKNTEDNDIIKIRECYGCSNREAYLYKQIYGDNFINNLNLTKEEK